MSINDLLSSEWVIPLLVVAGLVFFIAIPIIISKKEKEVFGDSSNSNYERTAVATIVDKKTEHNYLTQSITVDHVIFEFEDGSRIDLAVRNASTMVVGDKGQLRYSGNRFISFQRDI